MVKFRNDFAINGVKSKSIAQAAVKAVKPKQERALASLAAFMLSLLD